MIDLIQKRLSSYHSSAPVEEENALKEILQEIILFALWQADFFEGRVLERSHKCLGEISSISNKPAFVCIPFG